MPQMQKGQEDTVSFAPRLGRGNGSRSGGRGRRGRMVGSRFAPTLTTAHRSYIVGRITQKACNLCAGSGQSRAARRVARSRSRMGHVFPTQLRTELEQHILNRTSRRVRNLHVELSSERV